MVPAPFVVVLDANVLFPFSLRDTLLRAAAAGFYQLRWSKEILDETTRNLVESGTMPATKAKRLRAMMERAFSEAAVTDYASLVPAMRNDKKDRHVAAAAVKAGAQVIVTNNLKDFRNLPDSIEAQSPDEFLGNLLDLHPAGLLDVLREQAADLKDPPMCNRLHSDASPDLARGRIVRHRTMRVTSTSMERAAAGPAPEIRAGLHSPAHIRGLPPVRQELLDAAGRVGLDAREHVGQVLNRVDAMLFAGRHERVEGREVVARVLVPDKEIVRPTEGNAPQAGLGDVVVRGDRGETEEAAEGPVVLEQIANSSAHARAGLERASVFAPPAKQTSEEGARALASKRQVFVGSDDPGVLGVMLDDVDLADDVQCLFRFGMLALLVDLPAARRSRALGRPRRAGRSAHHRAPVRHRARVHLRRRYRRAATCAATERLSPDPRRASRLDGSAETPDPSKDASGPGLGLPRSAVATIVVVPRRRQHRGNQQPTGKELRRLILGRKNWLFAWLDEGGERTGHILSIIATCIAHNVNPRAYLHHVVHCIVHGWPQARLRELLPDRMLATQPELFIGDPDSLPIPAVHRALKA